MKTSRLEKERNWIVMSRQNDDNIGQGGVGCEMARRKMEEGRAARC
jgi:hypothetical protein